MRRRGARGIRLRLRASVLDQAAQYVQNLDARPIHTGERHVVGGKLKVRRTRRRVGVWVSVWRNPKQSSVRRCSGKICRVMSTRHRGGQPATISASDIRPPTSLSNTPSPTQFPDASGIPIRFSVRSAQRCLRRGGGPAWPLRRAVECRPHPGPPEPGRCYGRLPTSFHSHHRLKMPRSDAATR